MKKVDYRHFICVAMTIGFLAISVFVFPLAFGRLLESFKDIGTSAAYYFETLFSGSSNREVTVNNLTELSFELPFDLPNTWEEFQVRFGNYWSVWASASNFELYLEFLLNLFTTLAYAVVYALPFVAVVFVFRLIFGGKVNNDYNKDSLPLRAWKKVCEKVYAPTKAWFVDFAVFVREHRLYPILWVCSWLYNFNVFTIVICFIAYYLYFTASFDFVSLYRQVIKLLMDLSVAIDFIPLVLWAVIAFVILNKLRRKIGYKKLNHLERKDRGFINERPILTLVCGTMGKKKTTTITDMALSQEIMFRDKAFELLLKADLKFPYFPWINLEQTLKWAIAKHKVYNLATCKKYIGELQYFFFASMQYPQYKKYILRRCRKYYGAGFENLLFEYDFCRYGVTYDNALEVVDVWKIIEDYAQLYFIYIMQCSLIVSNYSIRTDNILEDLGNFPLWNTDLFKRDSRLMQAYSRHSHILDFDALRLGKKVVEDNKYANVFEFGVVLVTEIGKERGNKIELDGKKKTDEEANQKNDLFNIWLKMCRHSATVCNFPFVKIISDEQRPSSWGADAVDLCEIVYIKETSDDRLTMPFFSLGGLVCDWEVSHFKDKYRDYRYRRGDNTLLMYLWKGLTEKINNYRTRIYNTFGYNQLQIQVESGTRDGILIDRKYFLMFKKIYSRRFATDCYSDFYAQKALRSLVGLEDLPEYATVKATVEEFLKQNSYFMADLLIGLLKQKQSA